MRLYRDGLRLRRWFWGAVNAEPLEWVRRDEYVLAFARGRVQHIFLKINRNRKKTPSNRGQGVNCKIKFILRCFSLNVHSVRSADGREE